MPVTQSNVQTSPYVFSVTPASSKTYTLTAVANATCAGTVSGSALVTVNALPAIANQPAGATRCVGGSVTFTVGATGTGLSYQWKKDGVNIPQATGSTYSLNNLAVADAAEYTVEVSGSCSPAVVSEKAVLVVNQAPVISSQPVNEEVCVGSNASFSVTASNATGYQWQVNTGSGFVNVSNNAIYSGATTGTLIVAGAPASLDGYLYRVLVNGSCTPPTSDVATLKINTPPVITAGPAGATKCVGEQATFSVTATGTDLTYQWKKNGTNIPGATSSTFSIASTAVGDAGSYTVQVSGVCSAPVTSASAVLGVNQAPALTSQPANEEVCVGSNASFSVTASNATGYQWQVNTGSGFVNVSNNAIYSGATTGTLNVAGAPASLDGYLYRAVITGACPPVVTSDVVTLAVNTPPVITAGPAGATKCVGEQATFSVSATGTDLTYQWKKNGTNIPGATNSTYNIASTVVDDAGTYTVEVSAACGAPVVSSPSELVISVSPSITSQPTPAAICTGSNASFSVGASNATGYQWQVNTGSGFANLANGGAYSGANTATLLITGATTALNGYQYRAIATGTCPPVATSTAATLNVGNPTALGGFTPLAGPVLIGTSVKMTIAFSGSAPGTAVWNWNDGTTSNATVVGSTLTGTHVYAMPGVYTPTLTVNSCGGSTAGSYEYVVVYDPNGGYITGSGWFNSPAGAYRPQPSLEGRVNFGFVSKYKKGTTVPDGNTQFQYRMGNLSFHSTAYEWLVISGAKGQYKGSGTINGTWQLRLHPYGD
jgi:predicted secreted protein